MFALDQLVRDILRFQAEGFAAFASRFAGRDALFQQAVTLSEGVAGLAAGVDASGALRVKTDSGWRSVSSAEVSVRPC